MTVMVEIVEKFKITIKSEMDHLLYGLQKTTTKTKYDYLYDSK